jgi:ArsR family transcriptional regulator, arsenate/arsenite/antimonite-responsive transcriptional repressor
VTSPEHGFDKDRVTRFLTTVGDPARLQIIFLLSKATRMNVNEISAHFSMSRPAISHHLRVLRETGVVRSEKVGQSVYHWLDLDLVIRELRDLADLIAHYQAQER